ncbi:hypothetical protein PED39_05315 [Methanomassiliicoccales archaeon LGM-RCC1]|nr:hypothetical protein PED39_05315 [Methanomassiliicoccales archaeon LGM-RCC1]
MIQASIFDFKPKIIEQTARHIVLKDVYEEDGFMRAYRTDAKCIVDSIGTFFNGGALTDTRVLANTNQIDRTSDSSIDHNDMSLRSFLQLCSPYHKEIYADGTVKDWLRLSEYDPINHRYDSRFVQIADASMDSDNLYLIDIDGMIYDIKLEDDSRCDAYRITKYDPSVITEHFVNEVLRRGMKVRDVCFLIDHYSWALENYCPYTRDWKDGGMVKSDLFDRINDLADRVGIELRWPYTVEPLEPIWPAYPNYECRYCIHSECENRKNGYGCEKYIWNRKPIKPEHEDNPKRPRKSKRKAVAEDDECGCDDESEALL